MAHARLALRREELKWRAQPVWLPDRSKAIVADVRLYNRDDLLSRLGAVEWFRDLVSDAEIILALFERYGENTPDLLDGDSHPCRLNYAQSRVRERLKEPWPESSVPPTR